MDITAVYYTANKVPDIFADNVRSHLLFVLKDIPLISVSQKSLDFGTNICVGEIGTSIYNVYFQMLQGAEKADTKYVACCEDDCLYTKDHFRQEPKTFAYNMNHWRLSYHGIYWRRNTINKITMSTCIALRILLINVLKERFEKYTPENYPQRLGEPGKYERPYRLTINPIEHYHTLHSNIIMFHEGSISGVRFGKRFEQRTNLPYWGDSKELWRKLNEP